MPEKTCSTCQCNKVCDHNKYGFENCGNYISADVAPRAEVAREAIDVLCELHDHFKSVGDIREAFAMLFAIAELKKKYTEDWK